MADSERLLAGLQDYQTALALHVEQMESEFDDLLRVWESLYDHFQGHAADEFEPVWNGTSKTMKSYFEHMRTLSRVLDQRIDDLSEFDRS